MDKIYSLAPTYDAENNKDNEEILKSVLEEEIIDNNSDVESMEYVKKKNRNIAITGGYGVGKSSFINTFFQKNPEYKALNVTLASYIENEIPNEEESAIIDKEKINEIEYSILHQIIYTKRPHQLSFSHFNRIDKDAKASHRRNLKISAIVFLGFIFLLIFFNAGKIIHFLDKSMHADIGDWLFIIAALAFATIWAVSYLLDVVPIKRIKIAASKAEVEAEDDKDDRSILNRNIEELINFFMYTEYDIIVFEDIDRISIAKRIFNKLKEVNTILNSAIHNRTIRFIYALGDGLFEDPEIKLKLFDYIISIIPYVNNYNSIFVIRKLLSDRNIDLDNNVVKWIANRMSNARFVYNLVNEYSIFKKNSPIKMDDSQLFLLLAYKQIHPSEFEAFSRQKGKIAFFYEIDFEIALEEHINYQRKKRLEELTQKKQKYIFKLDKIVPNNNSVLTNILSGATPADNLKILKQWFKEKIEDEFGCPLTEVDMQVGNEPVCDCLAFICRSYDYINKFRGQKVIFQKRNNRKFWVDVITDVNENEFFSVAESLILEKKIKNFDNKISEKRHEIETFDFQAYPFDKKIAFLNDLKILPERFREDNVKKDSRELHDFEIQMLKSGLINIRYKKLLSYNTWNNSKLSDNDEKILAFLTTGKSLPQNYHIDDADMLLLELSTYDFLNDSINIKEIFKSLLTAHEYEDYLKMYFHNLTEKKYRFLLDLEDSGINIFKIAYDYLEQMFKFDPTDTRLLFNIVKYGNCDKFNENTDFLKSAGESSELLRLLENNYSEIEHKFSKFNIVFSRNVRFDLDEKQMIKKIYLEAKYSKCSNHIEAISTLYIYHFKLKHIFNSLSTTKAANLKNFLMMDIDDTIDNFIDYENIDQYDKDDVIARLIDNYHLDIKHFKTLMKHEKRRVTRLSLFKGEYLNHIIDLGFYELSWENIDIIFLNSNCVITPDIQKIIVDNAKNLASLQYSLHDAKLSKALTEMKGVPQDEYKILIQKAFKNQKIKNIREIDPNNLTFLIANRYIYLELKDLNYVIGLKSIRPRHQAELIAYNYKILLTDDKLKIPSNIALKILKTKSLNVKINDIIIHNINFLKYRDIEDFFYKSVLNGKIGNIDVVKHYLLSPNYNKDEKRQIFENNIHLFRPSKDYLYALISDKKCSELGIVLTRYSQGLSVAVIESIVIDINNIMEMLDLNAWSENDNSKNAIKTIVTGLLREKHRIDDAILVDKLVECVWKNYH